MSELRRNPLTGQWVIIADERSNRPHAGNQSKLRGQVPSYDENCPFCPGNESQTPPAVLEKPGSNSGERWYIRGFANQYAALSPDYVPLRDPGSPLFVARPGFGEHELLVETPVHNGFPAGRTVDEMSRLFQAYQQRFRSLMDRPLIQHVLIFKNHGKDAGSSLVHPHSQIIGLPMVPDLVQKSGEVARDYFDRTGRCILCQMAREESAVGHRMVLEDQHCKVFQPFAASCPAETWIVPASHQPFFSQASPEMLTALATALLETLSLLRSGFDDPDFNYVFHTGPCGPNDTLPEYWHWYVQLLPRFNVTAGLGLGTGIQINTLPPEMGAQIMRQARR